MQTTANLPTLINALLQQPCFDHPAVERELIETHISWVILAGDYVYKIKKPVNLGFLDFSTLEKRHFCCAEELRLNRRLAPEIYLAVVGIGGTAERPKLDTDEGVFEYAVKMHRFPQEAQLDRVLQRGELSAAMIDVFARMVAEFHQHAAQATAESEFGEPQQVWQPMAENFVQIREHLHDRHRAERLNLLEQWSRERYQGLLPILQRRKRDGYIRECHGDLHLRNLAWVDGRAVAFDCIEFNPALRWIDVISDIAFLVMDLRERDESRLAQRFLNAYLEISGDYEGLKLLSFYMVYRAMVRAKVAAIRSGQKAISATEREAAKSELNAYLQFAEGCRGSSKPILVIARGLSASGKSKHSGMLLEWLGAIRIRSDVERKRLYGMAAGESGRAAPGKGIYSASASEKTYARLEQLAAGVLDAGFPVIVDATCLQHGQRQRFYRLADEKKVPKLLVEFHAEEAVLRQRIAKRRAGPSDADLNVLEQQLAHWEPVTEEEKAHLLSVDTGGQLPESGELLYQQIVKKLKLN